MYDQEKRETENAEFENVGGEEIFRNKLTHTHTHTHSHVSC